MLQSIPEYIIFLVDHTRDEYMTLVRHFGQAWNLLRVAIAKVGQWHNNC